MSVNPTVGASTGTWMSKFKKPDEKSHPDPLKRYAALKKWNAMKDKVMGWQPYKTLDKAEEKMRGVEKNARAIQDELKTTRDPEKKRTLKEQLDALNAIRKKKKGKKKIK